MIYFCRQYVIMLLAGNGKICNWLTMECEFCHQGQEAVDVCGTLHSVNNEKCYCVAHQRCMVRLLLILINSNVFFSVSLYFPYLVSHSILSFCTIDFVICCQRIANASIIITCIWFTVSWRWTLIAVLVIFTNFMLHFHIVYYLLNSIEPKELIDW